MVSILIIDDEKLVLDGICRYLEKSDLQFSWIKRAGHGEEALALCKEERPDLILTDIKMPHMNGIELTEALSQIEGYQPYIIAISAYSDFSYVQKLIKFPSVVDYILKPINKKELLDSLQRAIQMHQTGAREKPVLTHIPEPDPVFFDNSAQEGNVLDIGSITSVAPLVRNVIDYVELHYMEPDLTLAQIAREFLITPNYLSYLFKMEMGTGFISYLRNFRIEKSKLFLKDIRLKVYEVADQVGINDARYYARTFKELTGMNPKEYREKCL